MSDAAEVAIEAALLAQAQAFADAQSLTIAMPNIAYTPPTPTRTAKWLRASFFPVPTETLSVAPGTNQHGGLFQIDCYAGAEGGEMLVARLAAAAIAYFKRGTSLSRDGFTIRILKAPYRTPLRRDDAWVAISVRIEFLCFANDPA